jgi:Xaa-Pro aminopeptidase
VPRFARLLVGNTDRVPDLTYATGLFVPDDFAWFQTASGKTFVLLGPLEIDRARRTGRADQCLDLSEEEKRMGPGKHSYPKTLANVLRRHGIRSTEIPCTFPIGLAHSLTQAGLKLQSVPAPFFPKRLQKSPLEIRHITQAIRAAEAGLTRAVEILRNSRIRKKNLIVWAGSALTSERLRTEMEIACLHHGALARDTIVSSGSQACDPHERGFGPLRANQAIILDIFPRNTKTGYFGDITRTIVKGRPSEALHQLRATVNKGQQRVLSQTRASANGQKIQDELRNWFRDQGYPTEIKKGRWSGFFHGVGHGLGLEIHEAPRFATPRIPLNSVLTVEPGLYVQGIGGVRIEDVFVVQRQGLKKLTRFPNLWEIR